MTKATERQLPLHCGHSNYGYTLRASRGFYLLASLHQNRQPTFGCLESLDLILCVAPVSRYVAGISRYVSSNERARLLPAQRPAGLILGDPRLKKVLLFLEIHHFAIVTISAP